MSDRFLIREATADDLPQMARLWRVAFNVPQHAIDSMPDRIRPPRLLVATDGDRLAATAQGFSLRQWFGGRPVPTVGVASVAVEPAHRGTGVGTEIMERLLVRARDQGHALATLYPATVPVYRRLGFEFAGGTTTYSVPIEALPSGPATDLLDVPPDGGPIRESWERLARHENGLTEGVDDDWWPWRVLLRYDDSPVGAVMTPEETPDGYAAYSQEQLTGEWGFGLECSHLVAHTPEAALALFAYFRRFKGVGKRLEWNGPPVEPLVALLPEQSVRKSRMFRNMSRILDVVGAFESRGYPDVTGSATFTVDDPLFPENAGTFVLEAEEGKVQLSRQSGGEGAAIFPVGGLSTLFTGYLTPLQAASVGLIPPDHPALDLLGRLFAGPVAWTPDFF
jgi:predicted acetyltransferase